jgi:uncharacterized protein (DUF433 family)
MSRTELEAELDNLSAAEKAEVVQRLARQIGTAFPGIETVDGGPTGKTACIASSRTPVWVLERYRRLGWTEARILSNYPNVRAVDLVQAWAYVDAHRAEIDRAIEENEAA